MAFIPGNRKRVWIALAAIGLAAWSGLACAIGPGSQIVFPPAPSQCVWEGVERVVAVGDLHGDCVSFVKILQDAKLIDLDEKWIGGTAHLVQIGDVVDRGDEARKIYIMISRLEQEAAAAGGKVHFLPGNHEEMNLAGVSMDYVGYVSLKQFQDFVPGAYRAAHERMTARMNTEDERRYWEALMNQRLAREEYYNGYRDAVGAWIVGHDVIIKINGVVFVHGGVSVEDSRRSLESINARYRQEFIEAMTDNQRPFQFVFQRFSPLWYRGLEGAGDSAASESDVKQILSNLKASSIVVGHSPTPFESAKHFGGLVWIIDSYISSVYETLNSRELSFLDIDAGGKITQHKGGQNGAKKISDGGVLMPWDLRGLVLRLRPSPAASHA